MENGCAARNSSKKLGKPNKIAMHRLIMNPPDFMCVDHIDNNRLNNQKSNLRVCTQAENSRNRTTTDINKSGYKGVYWHKQKHKWYAHITLNGKQRHLGTFANIEDAVKKYNEFAILYFGEFAKINEIRK